MGQRDDHGRRLVRCTATTIALLAASGWMNAAGALASGFPPAVAACIAAKLGAKAAAEVASTRRPTAAEEQVIGACFSSGGGGGSGSGTQRPGAQKGSAGGSDQSAAVRACITATLGAKAGSEIGVTRGPTSDESPRIFHCNPTASGSAGGSKPSAKSSSKSGAAATASKECLTGAALVKRALATDHEHPIPTAAEIACNAKKAKRRALPSVVVTTVLDPDTGDHPEIGKYDWTGSFGQRIYGAHTRIQTDGFPTGLGTHVSQGLPPYVSKLSNAVAFAEGLRFYQAVVLADKQAGKPTMFLFTLCGPGECESALPTTESAFRAWVKGTVAQRVAAVAKAAEAVRAELLLVPFESEPDVILNWKGLRDLPPATRVELAQLLVTTGLTAARKHFKGKLVAWRGWQLHAPNAEQTAFWGSAPMDEVRYTGYDIVLTTFFPAHPKACTPEYAKAYMAAQLGKAVELAKRDGVRWGTWEVDVLTLWSHTLYGECGAADLRAAHDPVLEVVLGALVAAQPRPALVWLYAGPNEWQNDAAFRKRLGARLTTFAREIGGG